MHYVRQLSENYILMSFQDFFFHLLILSLIYLLFIVAILFVPYETNCL